jgi:hypothetical protein
MDFWHLSWSNRRVVSLIMLSHIFDYQSVANLPSHFAPSHWHLENKPFESQLFSWTFLPWHSLVSHMAFCVLQNSSLSLMSLRYSHWQWYTPTPVHVLLAALEPAVVQDLLHVWVISEQLWDSTEEHSKVLVRQRRETTFMFAGCKVCECKRR